MQPMVMDMATDASGRQTNVPSPLQSAAFHFVSFHSFSHSLPFHLSFTHTHSHTHTYLIHHLCLLHRPYTTTNATQQQQQQHPQHSTAQRTRKNSNHTVTTLAFHHVNRRERRIQRGSDRAAEAVRQGLCPPGQEVHQARQEAVRGHCQGNGSWFPHYGIHWILRKAYPHSHQQHSGWELSKGTMRKKTKQGEQSTEHSEGQRIE